MLESAGRVSTQDERVQAAIEWAARAITGQGWTAGMPRGPAARASPVPPTRTDPAPGGALKELGALARIPAGRRSPLVRQAVDQGVAFLVSRDPAVADYPMGQGNTRPSSSWFKPGFPSGHVADVLQTLEVLAELGHGRDPASPTRSPG
jgi:hypothetical protein